MHNLEQKHKRIQQTKNQRHDRISIQRIHHRFQQKCIKQVK